MASPQHLTQPPPLHVVVTCTHRKRYPVPDRLRLGHLRERRPGPRFTAWTRRLFASTAANWPAVDLYAGEHWQVARTLPSLLAHRPATLWVCSAGYGLIPATATIQPYAATFAPGEVDSVGEDRAVTRDWWTRLTEWTGPDPGQPRSFAELARRDPRATIVAVLSDAYQRACAADVAAAAGLLRDAQQLIVVGAATADLADLVVPVTARLQPVVGGSLLALNVRVAAYLLGTVASSDGQLLRSRLRELVRKVTVAAPAGPERRAGTRLTDDEVSAFIRTNLDQRAASATQLLRRLRQSGRSCEQARFARLFAAVTTAGVDH